MEEDYITLTGRVFSLELFNENERKFYNEIRNFCESKPSWNHFSSEWIKRLKAFHHGHVIVGSPLYRICQDMGNRLGIEEETIAPPDYRDVLYDLIEEKFGSREEFCKTYRIPPLDLSRIFAGKKNIVLKIYLRTLTILDTTEEELQQRISM